VLLDTWLDAYGSFIPRRTCGLSAHPYSQAKLEALFADPDVTGWSPRRMARWQGMPSCITHARSKGCTCISSISCRQNRGLGLATVSWPALRSVPELGAGQIWLGVMVKNAQAVGWYKRMGYTVTETAPFVMGSTTVDHYIGYLPLPLPKPSGWSS